MKLINFMILVLSMNIIIAGCATVIAMPFTAEMQGLDPAQYGYSANTTPTSEDTTLDTGYGVSLVQAMSWREKIEVALFGFPALIRQGFGSENAGVSIIAIGVEAILGLLYLILGIEIIRGGKVFG